MSLFSISHMSKINFKQGLTTISIPSILMLLSLIISYDYPINNPLFLAALTTLVIHWIIGFGSILRKTEKVFDITGSIAVWSMIILTINSQQAISDRSWVLATFCILWTTRLGIFLLIRIKKHKIDKRFNELKTSPIDFFNTWQLSAAWTFITIMCALSAIISPKQVPLKSIDILWALLWALGFAVESIADFQKFKYKSKKQKTPFIQTGLWRYCRHPNYLGEISMWIFIALLSFPNLQKLALVSLISPIFVFFLLTKISGINLLEDANDKKFGQLKSYQDYKKTTPKLIPWLF